MKNELLAPNGKPSNLNATQYKLVRTPAFKRWFGQWDAEYISNQIANPYTAVKFIDNLLPTKSNAIFSLPLVQRLMLGLAHNHKVFGAIVSFLPIDVVNGITRKHIPSDKTSYNLTVFRDSINSSILDEYVSSLEQAVTRFTTKLSSFINGGSNEIPFTALEAKNLDLFIIGGLSAFESITNLNGGDWNIKASRTSSATKPSFSKRFGSKNNGAMLTSFFDIYLFSTHREKYFDKNNKKLLVSQVKDENGEPMVVYHGTTEDFSVFLGGSYFTDDYMNADGYASGEIVLETFLNIKKPLVINARGRKWDNLKNKYGTSTREIVSKIDETKYDGVIFNNVNDNWFDDENGEPQNVYFTINPNQIKLADGTNTTFDSENDDIRYTIGGEVNADGFIIEELDQDLKEVYQNRAFKNISGSDFYFSRLNIYPLQNVFTIELPNGEEIGRATLNEKENYLTNIRINENYRRKGLALNLYDFIEYIIGKKLKPSPDKISKEAEMLWVKRNPSIIFEQGGGINEEAQQLIDIISMNPNLEKYQKYKVLLKDKFGIDFDLIYKDQEYIDNATLNNIKSKDDFFDFGNWLQYAKIISTKRGFVPMDSYWGRSEEMTDENWNETAKKLDFTVRKVEYEERGTGSGDVARAFADTIVYTKEADLYYFLHEIGHIYDFQNVLTGIIKNPAYSPTNYGTTHSGETFAENFAIYFLNPTALKNWNEDVYYAMDSAINDKYKKELKKIVSDKSKFEKGGRTVSQTPSPKKDQVYGSNVNKNSSSKNISSAKLIKFDEKTLVAIKNKFQKHNEEYPDKKINLSSAKAVVRRGFGAYSKSHRPTISGGKPNSRVAWGLARLNAFIYKIINGKSKSGKYTQDDDLIEELGYKVADYKNGGEMKKDIRCINCGWEWNKKDSELWDMYVCHKCGFDNTTFYTSIPINNYSKGGEAKRTNPDYLKMFLDL